MCNAARLRFVFRPHSLLHILYSISEKDRPTLRSARSMDSLSDPSYPNEGAVTNFTNITFLEELTRFCMLVSCLEAILFFWLFDDCL